jgi:hypothetical protein
MARENFNNRPAFPFRKQVVFLAFMKGLKLMNYADVARRCLSLSFHTHGPQTSFDLK